MISDFDLNHFENFVKYSFMFTFNFETSSFFIKNFDHVIVIHQIYKYTHKHENNLEFIVTVKELIKFIVLINSNINYQISERFITKSQSIKFTSYFEN